MITSKVKDSIVNIHLGNVTVSLSFRNFYEEYPRSISFKLRSKVYSHDSNPFSSLVGIQCVVQSPLVLVYLVKDRGVTWGVGVEDNGWNRELMIHPFPRVPSR